tara:strand:- start:16876 stop:17679 length:804 start_codon:yes stop_codon:yes gene_type:complete
LTTESSTNSNTRLSIRLSQDGFSFWIIDEQSRLLQDYGESSAKQDTNAGEKDILEQLTQTILDCRENIDAVSLIYTTEVVIVHQSVFDEGQLKNYFQLSAPLDDCDLTYLSDDFERNYVFKKLPEAESLLTEHFDSFDLEHSARTISQFKIPKTIDQNFDEDLVIASIDSYRIEISLYQKARLQMFNSFPLVGGEDCLYYILNAIEQCEGEVQNTQLLLLGQKTQITNFEESHGTHFKSCRSADFFDIDLNYPKKKPPMAIFSSMMT